MSEKLIATDLWVLQAQETIRQQQAEIDRLKWQRDRLLDNLQPIVNAMNHNDGDTLGGCLEDSFVVFTGSGTWTGSSHVTLGDFRKIVGLIAEIEAGK